MGREADRIAIEIRKAWDGDPWHGAPILANLAGIDAAGAARRPVPLAHTIWELVVHLTAWTREVTRRLQGAAPAMPIEGDWPDVGDRSDEAWDRAVSDLGQAHDALAAALSRFPDDRLDHPVGDTPHDPPAGTGVTYREMLHGLAQHDAYHSGQVAMLRKALGD